MLVFVDPYNRKPPSSASLLHLLLQRTSRYIVPLCAHGDDMSAIPQTLQLVKAQKKQKSAGASSACPGPYFGMAELDQPMRYSSKLMNSIWGRYNENSVHNFKSLQCDGEAMRGQAQEGASVQQPPSPSSPTLTSSDAMKRRLRELGDAVAANFMDNLNQY